MDIPTVFNIQKFSIHDGPGIRTTIFFKGCPIKCLWCHNPESQRYNIEEIQDSEGKTTVCGKKYTVKELLKEAEKDIIFYEQSGGGVTLSGGEVMTQNSDYIAELVKGLYYKGISVCIDTCGVARYTNFEKILPYVDRFLYDLKLIDSDMHKFYTGVKNDIVLDNLKKLSDAGAVIDLRLIQLDKVNNREEDVDNILSYLKENNININKIHLLPYHKFGSDKYDRLNREKVIFETPSEEILNNTKQRYEKAGYTTVLGG